MSELGSRAQAQELAVTVCPPPHTLTPSQGGAHVEVFSAQGRDPVSQWRLVGGVRKEYHKAVRGYVYCLEGGSSSTSTRMQFPRSDKATCTQQGRDG